MKNKIIKIILITQTLIIAGLLIYKRPAIQYVKNTDIIKTVEHIILDKRYQEIFRDSENDIAYYRKIDNKPILNIGDKVKNCNNESVTVTATDVYGFYVTFDNKFYPGMSGTVIRNEEGIGVGYVSTIMGDVVYCIWR